MRTFNKTGFLTELASRWVHSSALDDADLAKTHARFILSHLSGGLLALLMFPLWLAAKQGVTAIEAGVFLWLILPIAFAALVSKTGNLQWGVNCSLLAASGFIAWFGALSGGLNSGILFWLCILPIEAALFGGRKTVLFALGAAIAGIAAVMVAQIAFPAIGGHAIGSKTYTYSLLATLVYGAMLAFRIDHRRQHSKARVVAEEGKFKLLADNSTDLITLHSENGDTRYASTASENLLNVAPGSLLGSGLFDRVHLHDRIAYKTAFSDAAKSGVEVSVAYRVNVSTAGSNMAQTHKWLETRCRKFFDPSAGTTEIVAVSRDISAVKENEAALTSQRNEAEKSSEAKSRFLANMSHELRTPLNAIIGFSDILKQDLFGKLEFEKHNEYVNLINDSGHHLLHLVNDILDISKIEAGRYEIIQEPFDLHELISGTCLMLLPQAECQNIDIVWSVPEALPELNADRRACKQILINLLSNAIKFSHPDSSVKVEVATTSGHVQIYVRDEGIGITKDNLDAIGRPFFQIESDNTRGYEGTGLGLFLVKGLVELHKGTLKVDSTYGEGTTVCVSLPVEATKSRPVPANESETLVRLHTRNETIEEPTRRSNHYERIQAQN